MMRVVIGMVLGGLVASVVWHFSTFEDRAWESYRRGLARQKAVNEFLCGPGRYAMFTTKHGLTKNLGSGVATSDAYLWPSEGKARAYVCERKNR